MSAPGAFSEPSGPASSVKRLYADIRNYRCLRIFEIWSYAVGLTVLLGSGGWLLAGLPRIFLPVAAVGVSGGVLGTLLAAARAREARRQVDYFVDRDDSRSLHEIGLEIERDPGPWADPTAIRALTHSIFG
jgi:hypothetical protein